MKTILKLILIYFGFQFLGGLVSAPIIALIYGTIAEVPMLASALCLGSIFMICYLFAKKKYIRLDELTWSVRSAGVLALVIVLGLSFYFFAGGINEMVGLPNMMEDEFTDLSFNILGVLGIVVIGPIAEELLFRGAILGYLLKKGNMKPQYAILISALIFGLIHMNPAQIIYAFLLGLLLGRLYYQSGSLILCIVIHVLLNGFSTLLTICYPEAQTYEDMGASATLLNELLVLGAILSVVSGYYLNRLLKAPAWVVPEEVKEAECDVVTNEKSEE